MSGDMPSESLESNSEHAYFMKQALLMGEKALETGETPVGCVLVYDKKIVGFGMNDTNKSMNGTRHAEFIAIEEMLETYPSIRYGKYTSVVEMTGSEEQVAFYHYMPIAQ
ncbi:hypothetical protein CBS63078_10364 [Aspergillus niger]|nr:hypothetical protein CBS115989_9993 [Aspergillus niger]KAI2828907.1 hypothetical protein CBS133816_4910 [Aspergillus niger]KAI2838551.1 hypothetical protein CBS11232_9601 [Aspergillus niger]KAI2845439.1 hypothetical protein CBS12448_9753 [Aspergillus niger]KAI2851407.1 hypothetical protein CBS11350_1311 [Aspergillus niger]